MVQRSSRRRTGTRWVAVMALAATSVLLGAVPGSPAGATVSIPPYPELLPLHATRGSDPGLFDSDTRRVLLRGVNYNKLGDYDQGNPAYPTVLPEHPDDFPQMARLGFSVVRLLVSWSSLEPTPGAFDTAYLDRIAAAVAAAKANGLYVVIDMHQDAWGKAIGSPPGTICPPGTTPAIGWDGAPAWATIFDPGPDNANTCRPGSRESSEAVMTAWDNFYLDTGGIQSHLVSTWRNLANRFGTEAAVAGFDLLNEPNEGHPANAAANVVRLGQFYAAAIAAIRAGEADSATAEASALSHPIIFETSVVGTPVPYDFTTDTNIVLSGHNYGESITDALTVEAGFGYFDYQAHQYGTTLWIGEYGFFSVTAAHVDALRRYGVTEDNSASTVVVGSAWWQFEQACGDPHSINTPGGTPAAELIHLKRSTCPGDAQGPPIPEWTETISRAYPRAVPGRVTSLVSDGAARTMTLRGAASGPQVGGRFIMWVPGATPSITGTGIRSVTVSPVDGGSIVAGFVCGDYTIAVDQPGVGSTPPANCPAVVAPRFTG